MHKMTISCKLACIYTISTFTFFTNLDKFDVSVVFFNLVLIFFCFKKSTDLELEC